MTGLIPVLRAGVSGRNDFDPALLDPAGVRWAVHTGLGPLICHICRNHLSGIADAASQDLLRSADMVAQLAMSDALDALEEMLAASADIAREIILLKGISTCQYLYPMPHLRTMGDIDLLVPARSQQRFETLLLDLGYRQQSSRPAEFYETHHHSMPFFHPAKQLWVEVHTALFSNANVVSDPVFSIPHLDSQTVPITLHGHRTNRLSLEQEMIYIATHWALERKCFAGGVMPFVDMAYLIHKYGHEISWERLLVTLKDSKSAVYLYLMLRYLKLQEIITLPSMVMERLVSKLVYPLGPSETVLHALIDSYSMNGGSYGKGRTFRGRARRAGRLSVSAPAEGGRLSGMRRFRARPRR
jgi:hypothetical protein